MRGAIISESGRGIIPLQGAALSRSSGAASSGISNLASSVAACRAAHRIRCAQPGALGRKVSDEYTIPVCRLHLRELHRYGDEASWWAAINLDPLPIA
jgi:hypothetical protein